MGDIVIFGNYTINIYSEIAGLLALIVVIIGYFGKTRKQFYLTQVIANVLLSTGFIIKGNWLAGIGIAIATARSLTFLLFDLKGKNVPLYVVGVFILMFIGNGIYNWSNALDLLSIIALILNTIFCLIKDQKTMKLCMILPVTLTIVYDIFAVFITKTILKSIELGAIIVYFVKIKIESNKKDKELNKEKVVQELTSNANEKDVAEKI